MGFKTLELTLVGAKDLKNVSMMGKMDVYVVVSLSGDPTSKQKTRTHTDGGTSPCWNQTLRFTFEESIATHAGWSVLFVLKHDAFGPDKDLGEVHVPVKDLLSGFEGKKEPEFVTYQVRRSSGKGKGDLKISYKITDAADPHQAKAAPAPAPAGYPGQAGSSGAGYGYPPPPGAAYAYPAASGYPPHQSGYPPPQAEYPVQGGYGYPQATPYGGYPPQQPAPYGYGYPQGPAPGGYPQQKPAKNKKGGGSGFGMGMGAGLVGGAVGGLIIGEMLEDSFDCDGDF